MSAYINLDEINCVITTIMEIDEKLKSIERCDGNDREQEGLSTGIGKLSLLNLRSKVSRQFI